MRRKMRRDGGEGVEWAHSKEERAQRGIHTVSCIFPFSHKATFAPTSFLLEATNLNSSLTTFLMHLELIVTYCK
jgi:hypothetical protein